MMVFTLAASAAAITMPDIDLNRVPVEPAPFAELNMRVAVSDSVKAATWDDLPAKPDKAIT